jgi:hypothetical protein
MFGIPNCVPEFYREQEEREQHEYEKKLKWQEHYEESKRRLDEAHRLGYPVLLFGGYDECWNCKKKCDIQTSYDDDMGALVCYDKKCKCHERKDEE